MGSGSDKQKSQNLFDILSKLLDEMKDNDE